MAEGPQQPQKPKFGVPMPYAVAIVICDAVWRDPWTGKLTIIGTFETATFDSFPGTHPVLAVYIALTDGRGKVRLKLRLIDANEEREPIFETEAEAEFPDPRVVLEWSATIGEVIFPLPGEYKVQLFAGNEYLGARRIVVRDAADRALDSE